MKKKIINWIGRSLVLLSILLIVHKLWEYHEDIKLVWSAVLFGRVLFACFFYSGIVYVSSLVFQSTLYITTGYRIRYDKAAYVYCKSNMYKYLPGNVMHYVGRNEIAERENLPHSEVACSTVLEIAVTTLSAILPAVLFSWRYSWEWVTRFAVRQMVFLICAGMAALLIGFMLCVIFWKKASGILASIMSIKKLALFLTMVLYHGVILVVDSMLYFFILDAIGIRMKAEAYLPAIGLYALSFLLGYLTPGAPGGIGIRETVMIFFFSAFLPQDQILTGALLFRVVTVMGDFMAFGIAWIAVKGAALRKKDEQAQ